MRLRAHPRSVANGLTRGTRRGATSVNAPEKGSVLRVAFGIAHDSTRVVLEGVLLIQFVFGSERFGTEHKLRDARGSVNSIVHTRGRRARPGVVFGSERFGTEHRLRDAHGLCAR